MWSSGSLAVLGKCIPKCTHFAFVVGPFIIEKCAIIKVALIAFNTDFTNDFGRLVEIIAVDACIHPIINASRPQ